MNIIAIAATITATGVITGAAIAAYRIAKRLESAIGVDKNGRSIADRVDRIEHQVWPNGGGSLMDKVTAVDHSLTEMKGEQKIIRDLLSMALNRGRGSTDRE